MKLPYSICQFSIENFQGIKETKIDNLPSNARWIFLTGKNGYGKTSLLKAITIGLYGKEDVNDGSRKLAGSDTKINLQINKLKGSNKNWVAKGGEYSKIPIPVIAYGPIRIPSGRSADDTKSNVKSLFSTDGDILYNFEQDLYTLFKNEENEILKRELELQPDYNRVKDVLIKLNKSNEKYVLNEHIEDIEFVKDKKNVIGEFIQEIYNNIEEGEVCEPISHITELEEVYNSYIHKRGLYSVMRDFLLELMDNIKDIQIKDDKVVYFEKDEPDIAKRNSELASGNRMLLSWVGDMLIRLGYKNYDSPKEIEGIVVVDEFDLHLHPIWQKKLPGILSHNLPNIQFIASTHSPIPLLGAPEGSVFIKVNRSKEDGIVVERLDDKIYFEELMPNTLLTSPTFGMEDIFSSNYKGSKPARTELSYAEKVYNDDLDSKITDFLTEKKQRELIARIKERK
ncbi:MAG: AAA family ATPase [Marinifilaceae bacterium]|jgi:predicted ATP-binding protein involved in virulence|nr:AAA family ATPase [Marinifilaceae bacterium]